jgi:hypothetical protein
MFASKLKTKNVLPQLEGQSPRIQTKHQRMQRCKLGNLAYQSSKYCKLHGGQ